MDKKSYMGVQTGKNLGLVISTFKVGKTESQRERERQRKGLTQPWQGTSAGFMLCYRHSVLGRLDTWRLEARVGGTVSLFSWLALSELHILGAPARLQSAPTGSRRP